MKRIFTLFSTVLLSIAVFAAAPKPKSMLTIQSMTRGDMKVVIDGRRFEPRENMMRLQGLKPGYHKIKIYQERSGGYYNMIGRRYELVFNSSITVRPHTNLVISIDRYGRASIREARFNGYGNGRNNRIDDRDRNYDRDNSIWGDDYRKDQDFEFDNDGRGGDYNWDDRGNYNDNFGSSISDREFTRVIESINKEWLESNKMKSASQVINANFLTSAQVRQMLFLFSFENNRVDLAKQAYAKTVDKRNFMHTLDDAFSFNTSKEELARFIRNVR